jgi:hypothetical protein
MLKPEIMDDMDLPNRTDAYIAKIVAGEKALEPKPYAAIRILQHIESELQARETGRWSLFPRILQPALVVSGLVVALFLGVAIGRHKTTLASTEATAEAGIETLRSELFLSDFTDEENTLYLVE